MKTHTKRTTVYLDSQVHKALRVKAAETEHSMSQLVEEAIRVSLAEERPAKNRQAHRLTRRQSASARLAETLGTPGTSHPPG